MIAYVVPTRGKLPEDKKQAWKRKHKLCWRSPCEVVRKLSATYYEVKELKTGRSFNRSVALLGPWRGPAPRNPAPAEGSGPKVGQLVVAVDEVGDRTYSLARVLRRANDSIHLHYFGTVDEDIRRARFTPTYIEEKTGLMLLDPPQAGQRAKPWAGWVPEGEGHIILKSPRLTKDGKLSPATRRRLRNMQHFVIPSDD